MITEEERLALVKYRLQRAEETMRHDVAVNVQNRLWNTAANRLYYAAFYALTALLLKQGHNTQTHKGVKNVFYEHFIRTGLVSAEKGRHYSILFDKRQAGDYADLIDWTEKDILPLIEPTKNFIETIKNLIAL